MIARLQLFASRGRAGNHPMWVMRRGKRETDTPANQLRTLQDLGFHSTEKLVSGSTKQN